MILRHTVQYPGRRGPLIDGLVKAKGCSIFLEGGRVGTNPTPDEDAVPPE